MRIPEPDPELVRRAAGGEVAAQRELMEAWGPAVLRWATWLARPGVDPEDVAHDVLFILLTKLRDLRDAQAFQAWLFRIVRRTVDRHNKALWLRRWSAEPVEGAAVSGLDPHREAERNEAQLTVQAALSTLKRPHREILVLCLLEEQTCLEASQILGIPEGTAKRRLQLARVSFRRAHARITLTLAPRPQEEKP